MMVLLSIVGYVVAGVLILVASQWHPDISYRSTCRDLWIPTVLIWPFVAFVGLIEVVMASKGNAVSRYLRSIGRDREREP